MTVSEQQRSATIRTIKASGLSARINIATAERFFRSGDAKTLEGWFSLWEDMKRCGVKASPYAEAYASHPTRKCSWSASTVKQYLGAIDRAVAKHGTLAKARKAHDEWVKANRYCYADITNFMKFAPAGRAAKPEARQVHVAVTITRVEGVKRLRAGGYSSAEANRIATALGLI